MKSSSLDKLCINLLYYSQYTAFSHKIELKPKIIAIMKRIYICSEIGQCADSEAVWYLVSLHLVLLAKQILQKLNLLNLSLKHADLQQRISLLLECMVLEADCSSHKESVEVAETYFTCKVQNQFNSLSLLLCSQT